MPPVTIHEPEETAEAVVISGPRKGEFITISGSLETALATPEAETLLDDALNTANGILESLREMRQSAEAFHLEMERKKQERNELLRSLARGDAGTVQHQP